MTAFQSLSRAMALGLLRDRAAVFFMLIFPLMFLVLFGTLMQEDNAPTSTVVQIGDVEVLDGMPAARLDALDEALTVERSADRAQALADLRAGDVEAVVWQEDDRVEMRYSAADSVRAGTVRGLMSSIVSGANIDATGQPPAYTLSTSRVEDESLQPIQFITSGLLGWAIAMAGSFLSALTLVSWRKKRILRRLWLAPVRPGTVIGARVGVSLALSLAQLAIFLGVAVTPFYGLQLTGNWWLSVPLVACGTLAFMSIGLLIGAWAQSEEAANGALQLVVLPMAFLSGSFFPTDMLPGWVQALSQVLPLKHLNEALQDVLSRGGGWSEALPAMGILLAFSVAATAIAARLFRWDAA